MTDTREQKLIQTNKTSPRYQDYVISDGKLVGDWEGLYQNFEDPWHQSRSDHTHDSRRMLALSWCNTLREKTLKRTSIFTRLSKQLSAVCE